MDELLSLYHFCYYSLQLWYLIIIISKRCSYYVFQLVADRTVLVISFTFSWWMYRGFSCWRHQMETFSAWLALCEGNSPVTGEFPSQKPVTQSFDVFSDLRPNRRLSKQSRRRWFETPSRQIYCHCNVLKMNQRIDLSMAWRYGASSRLATIFIKILAPWRWTV